MGQVILLERELQHHDHLGGHGGRVGALLPDDQVQCGLRLPGFQQRGRRTHQQWCQHGKDVAGRARAGRCDGGGDVVGTEVEAAAHMVDEQGDQVIRTPHRRLGDTGRSRRGHHVCGRIGAQVDGDRVAGLDTVIEQDPRKAQRQVPELGVCQLFAGIDDRSLFGMPLCVVVDDVRDRLVAPHADLTEAARGRGGLHPRNVAVDHIVAPSQRLCCGPELGCRLCVPVSAGSRAHHSIRAGHPGVRPAGLGVPAAASVGASCARGWA